MKFNYFFVEKSKIISEHLVAPMENFPVLLELWKRQPDFVEYVQQLIVTAEVVACNLVSYKSIAHLMSQLKSRTCKTNLIGPWTVTSAS
jgi:hypothetical protein